MYVSQEISERIKKQAKKRDIALKDVLQNAGTGVNFVSHLSKGQEVSYLTLAKIADILDCSVDYLLCRTENPNSHNTHVGDISINPNDEQLTTIIETYKQLNTVGKAKLLVAIDKIKRDEEKQTSD